MESVQEPSASPQVFIGSNLSCSIGSHVNSSEIQEEEEEALSAKSTRAGFSDSFSSHDMEESMDGSSLRGITEDCSRSSESETASSRASTSDSECHSNARWPPLPFQKVIHCRSFFSMLKKGSASPFHTLPSKKSVPKLTRREMTRVRDNMVPALNSCLDSELYLFKSSWKNLTLAELQAATNNFSKENLIGQGGYAEVYKGQLEDGQYVAIKRLTRGSPEEMTADFLSELGIIVHVDHPNIAKLIGYGVEGGMHLVLQLSPNGSLASILYGPREKLDWGIRYKVALGTAKGLVYLHEWCQRRIIHKDIKASNILLSEDFEPQISDFGLAKWLPDQMTHHTVSNFEGTFGYLPPEFFMHGIVDEKTDVYAYGVLLLELITGHQALDSSQQSVVMWAKPFLAKNSIRELADPSLANAYDAKQMNCLISTASLCINQSSILRPQMSQVVQILKGDESSLELVKQRQKSIKLQRTYSVDLSDSEEYNSTKHLNDMDQYMQIVLACNEC